MADPTVYGRWDADSEQQLEQLWAAKVRPEAIAALLGRSVASVRRKVWLMKLEAKKPVELEYSDDANRYIVWVCDELHHQQRAWGIMVQACGITYNRGYDLRMRGYVPTVTEIDAMLEYVGYQFELVPIKGSAHNGPDKGDA